MDVSDDPALRLPSTAPTQTAQRPPRYWLTGLLLLALAGAAAGGVKLWEDSQNYESTDDAAVDGHILQISPQMTGQVARVDITDNQSVRAGQLLVEIDPRHAQLQLDQALAQQAQGRAQLAQAQAQLTLQKATIQQATAQLAVTEAELTQAQQDAARFRAIDPQAITRQQLDNAAATARAAAARLDANQHAVEASRAQLGVLAAQQAAASAALESDNVAVRDAELALSYTRVTAPEAGRVTRRSVEPGNYVTQGQTLLELVPAGLWVTANFKETQLARLHPGQPVDVSIEAIPDQKFTGYVDSFQAGSGAAFSVLPAENATGNFVKVVQRVPVKIRLDDSNNPRLAIGLSAEPRVRVR